VETAQNKIALGQQPSTEKLYMTERTHSILVVDDEKEFLELVVELLSEEGYEVVSCLNGKEAAEQLARGIIFSAIIADYKMPVMKGTEFLEIAKKSFPHCPRIMITAHQDAEMMEESINKAEVFRFVTKPIDIEEFSKVVRSAVEKFESHIKEEEEKNKKMPSFKQSGTRLNKVPWQKMGGFQKAPN
jgi:DNA-binding NtrC family response regulator